MSYVKENLITYFCSLFVTIDIHAKILRSFLNLCIGTKHDNFGKYSYKS